MVEIKKIMDRGLIFYVFLLGALVTVDGTINITELNMPESIELGSTDEMVIDCDFEIDESDHDVVIKLFYNGDNIIYQWIPDFKNDGSSSDFLKNHLDRDDLNHTEPGDSPMFLALKLRNISRELSGNYTCQVSSFESEKSKTKQLIVYSAAQSNLDIMLFASESLVICTVHGISPEPKMDFYIRAENGSRTDVSEEVELIWDEDGYFNVTAKHHFQNLTLPKLTTFVCNLSIPGTDYVLTKTWELRSEVSNSTDVLEEDNDLITSLEECDDNATYADSSVIKQDYSGVCRTTPLFIPLILLLLAAVFLK